MKFKLKTMSFLLLRVVLGLLMISGVGALLFFEMPLERDILRSQKTSAEGMYNIPLELKGRTFYVSYQQWSAHALYVDIFFLCTGAAVVGLLLIALAKAIFRRRI